jgi:hypothetical protein
MMRLRTQVLEKNPRRSSVNVSLNRKTLMVLGIYPLTREIEVFYDG